jgi:nucleobase:cation symporter-1, NCS1 family
MADRHWDFGDFASFWITMVISITTYYLAASLVDLGKYKQRNAAQ